MKIERAVEFVKGNWALTVAILMCAVCAALLLAGLWRILWRWQLFAGLQDLALGFCLWILITLKMEAGPPRWLRL